MLNDLDRFHLVGDVVDRVPSLGTNGCYSRRAIRDALVEHRQYVNERGEDDPRILGWRWDSEAAAERRRSSTEGDNV